MSFGLAIVVVLCHAVESWSLPSDTALQVIENLCISRVDESNSERGNI